MGNPNPSPNFQNLRPPWQRGTSGNPAGYSRGRRISDVIKTQIQERGLESEFANTAIAVALGYEQYLAHKVTDPETGKEILVEPKPSLPWFKLILDRTEPGWQKPDNMAVLDALRERFHAQHPEMFGPVETSECPEPAPGDPAVGDENGESAGLLSQALPAVASLGQAALTVPQTLPRAAEPDTTLAVKRPFDDRIVPIRHGLLALLHPARQAVQLFGFLAARVARLFTAGIRRSLAGNMRIGPGFGRGLGRTLVEIVAVVLFLLVHQAIVRDHQSAREHVVQGAAVVADVQHGLDIQVMGRLVHDRLASDLGTAEVAAGQAAGQPRTSLTRPTFPVHYPVLAPERGPDRGPPKRET